MGPQKNLSPLAGFEPRTFGTQGENATTPPRDSKLHEKKYYFARWTRRFKFCPKCPYHTQNEHIVAVCLIAHPASGSQLHAC